MSRKLQVYGWTGFDKKARQRRLLVAAPSFAEFRRIVNAAMGQSPTRNYVDESGNALDLEVALNEPGVIFSAPDVGRARTAADYEKLDD